MEIVIKEIIEEAFTEVVFPWGSALSAKKVIRHQKKSKADCDYTFNPKDYPSHPDINVFRRSSSVNYTCIDWTLEMKNLDRPVKNDAPKSSFLDSHQANFKSTSISLSFGLASLLLSKNSRLKRSSRRRSMIISIPSRLKMISISMINS